MKADGSDVHRISRSTGNEFAFARPQWQPGGDLIVYYAGDPSRTDGAHDIYVARADGSSEARITTDSADDYWPVWSPDGSRLAFERDDTTYRIVIVDPDGRHAVVGAPLNLTGA